MPNPSDADAWEGPEEEPTRDSVDPDYERYLEELAEQALPLTPAQQLSAEQAQIEEWEDRESNRYAAEPDSVEDDRS